MDREITLLSAYSILELLLESYCILNASLRGCIVSILQMRKLRPGNEKWLALYHLVSGSPRTGVPISWLPSHCLGEEK